MQHMESSRQAACADRVASRAPAISVLAPTWNRGSFLQRVWEGLNSQKFRDFEWIIADDGSSDDTGPVARALAEKSPFPVTILTATRRIGKARLDNEAVAAARGDMIVWNDSDDYLLPTALEKMHAAWQAVLPGQRHAYAGVVALCDVSKLEATHQSFGHLPAWDIPLNDLSEVHHVRGDMLQMTRADLLKRFRFPEVDFVVPEGSVWTSVGHLKVRILPAVLMIKEYRAPNAISFSGKQEYCRGRAYAMAISEGNLLTYKRPLSQRLWRLTTFIRYSLHGEIDTSRQIHLWRGNTPLLWYVCAYPLAWMLAKKDALQGKVRKTHREFVQAAKTVEIQVHRSPRPIA
jgi:glycosyltransferase involved in cell wall biosynthesis